MKKISILYLIDQMRNMGGAELNLLNIMTHLNSDRFRFSLYTFHSGAPMKNLLAGKNIDCIQIPYPTTAPGFKNFLALAKEMKGRKVNIVHTYFEGADIWGTILAKLAGIPVVISSKRDMGFSKNKKILLAYRLINPFVTRIVSVCEAVKYQAHRQEKVNLNKIVTIYNGVDDGRFQSTNRNEALKQELKLDVSAPVVGLLANIRPIKGIEFFIQAAGRVLKQVHTAQFIIVGQCNPGNEAYFDKLQSMVKELNLEDKLFFLGARKDIPALLSIMDISVLSSLSEGFSNTIIESMAAGKPLVVTDVGGNAEAVVDGATGFVVPHRNVDKLAEAIATLIQNPAQSHEMGEAGRIRARNIFSIETMMGRIEELYISVLKNNRAAV